MLQQAGTGKSQKTASATSTGEATSDITSSPTVQSSESDEAETATVNRKRKKTPKKQELMLWLENYGEQQAEAERRRLELARQTHRDNLKIMNSLVDILKQVVSKK